MNLTDRLRQMALRSIPRKDKHGDRAMLNRKDRNFHVKKCGPRRVSFRRFWRTFKEMPQQPRAVRRRLAMTRWRESG